MAKVKELWAKLVGAMRGKPKSTQAKAFVRVIQFFAVMLVLTIFARGASAVTMPRVTSAGTHNAEITESIDTVGNVGAEGTVDIELPAGLTVSKIITAQGSTIKEGADLLEFDLETLNDQLKEQKLALRTMELELRELQLPADDETGKAVEQAQKALAKAQEAYNKATEKANAAGAAAAAAREHYNTLFAAFEEASRAYDAELAKPADQRDENLLAQLLDTREAAYVAQDTAFNEIGPLEESYTMAKDEQSLAADGVETAQETLSDAQEARSKAQQTGAITRERNNLSAEQKQNEIDKQSQLITTLEAAIANEGKVIATTEGIVTQMPAEEGEATAEGAKVRISTAADGYTIECQVEQKEAASIKVGDKLSVKQPGYYYTSEAPVISKTVANAEGKVTLRASLPGTDWEAGQALDVQVITKRQQYGTCVPLSAVHTDSAGNYVFVLREENTILGEQTVARRVDVNVAAQDRKNVAIDGDVWGEQILVSSTKPVKDGDRVRIEGEAS